MNFDKLNNWLIIAANSGVIMGLVFVGLQLKQDRQIALADNVDEVASRQIQWAELVGENSEIWTKGLLGEALSDSEYLIFRSMHEAWEVKYYTAWYRSNLTLSEQDSVRFAREAAIDLFKNPGLLEIWLKYRERLNYTGARGAINSTDANTWEGLVRRELNMLQSEGYEDNY